jgi:putative transposase
VSDLYTALDAIARDTALPTTTICEVLDLSRSAYYDWLNREPGVREHELEDLTPTIVEIFLHHRRRYGARRIAEELKDRRIACSVKRVATVLKNQGLRAIQPKSFVPKTTDSRHTLGYSPNLLGKLPPPRGVNQIWVADITYIPLRAGDFGYLALALDLFSRRVVGWELRPQMTEPLVLQVLRHAIRWRQPPAGLIHHSDRGSQYAARGYRAMLRRAGIRQSMSRAGNCYDNAFMESCFGTIKTELEMTEYDNYSQARDDIARYLAYYNTERRHSALDYLSPAQFETIQTLNP